MRVLRLYCIIACINLENIVTSWYLLVTSCTWGSGKMVMIYSSCILPLVPLGQNRIFQKVAAPGLSSCPRSRSLAICDFGQEVQEVRYSLSRTTIPTAPPPQAVARGPSGSHGHHPAPTGGMGLEGRRVYYVVVAPGDGHLNMLLHLGPTLPEVWEHIDVSSRG